MPRTSVAMASGILFLLATVSVAGAAPRRLESLRCAGVEGTAEVLVPGVVVMLAEIPGTVEMPRFAAALACQALATGRPVTLALEIPREEDDAVQAFLSSDGSPAAREELLRVPSWRQPEASAARLELLEWIRATRAAGNPIWVALLGAGALPAVSSSSEREREQRMAAALLAARDATPQSVVIGLVSNHHARLVRDTGANPPYPPMAYLVERELPAGFAVYALDARHPTGKAWTCAGAEGRSCGPVAVSGRGQEGASFRVVLGGDVDRTFNGYYQLPSLTPSPPARSELGKPGGPGSTGLAIAR